MMLGGEASSSKASRQTSLKAGSKTVSRSDKEMEVFMTSISTKRPRGWITKSCHEPLYSPSNSLVKIPFPAGLGRCWCCFEMHGITQVLDLPLQPLRPVAFHRFRDAHFGYALD